MIRSFKKSIEIYLFLYLLFITGTRYQVAQADGNRMAITILGALLIAWVVYALVEKKKLILPLFPSPYVLFILALITSTIHSVNIGSSAHELYLWTTYSFIFLGIINIINYGWDQASLLNSAMIAGLFYNAVKLYPPGLAFTTVSASSLKMLITLIAIM